MCISNLPTVQHKMSFGLYLRPETTEEHINRITKQREENFFSILKEIITTTDSFRMSEPSLASSKVAVIECLIPAKINIRNARSFRLIEF